jgi:hypothetical protein
VCAASRQDLFLVPDTNCHLQLVAESTSRTFRKQNDMIAGKKSGREKDTDHIYGLFSLSLA